MSDLIDRYVTAVAANLPKRDRDDVPAELRDILYSKVEAREAELGRPLTRAEEEAILQAYGHPLAVAGSYAKQQVLIGPAVYPFYIFTLKVVGGILLALWVAGLVLREVAQGRADVPDPDIAPVLFTAGGIITLVFALIERYGKTERAARMFKWRPSQLPSMGAPKGRSPFEILWEIACATIAALWWAGVLEFPYFLPGSVRVSLSAEWSVVYWPILIMLVLQIALNVFELVMPGLARVHIAARTAWHVVGFGLFLFVGQFGHWIDATGAADRPDLRERIEAGFNNGFKIGLAFTLLIFLWEIGRGVVRLVRWGRLEKLQTVRAG